MANKRNFKNTSVYWFRPPKLAWRPRWFPDSVSFRHITGISQCTNFTFKFWDADGEEAFQPGFMLGRVTSEAKRWKMFPILPTLNVCKRCTERYLRPVSEHKDGADCLSLPKYLGQYKQEMRDRHAAMAQAVGSAALGKDGFEEYCDEVRPMILQNSEEVTVSEGDPESGAAVEEEKEDEASKASDWDDSEEEEVFLDDLEVNALAIIESGAEAPHPPFDVVKVLAKYYERGTYKVQYYGDYTNRSKDLAERRLCKQAPFKNKKDNSAW